MAYPWSMLDWYEDFEYGEMNVIEEIFTTFYESNYNSQVKRISRHLRGDRDLAQDIVASAYEKMWRYRETYDPNKSGVVQWFNTILYNTLRSEVSSSQDLEEYGHEDRPSVVSDAIEEVKNTVHRTVLKLHLLHGYREKEIKKLLGDDYKSGDVRKIVFRFRKRLKAQYASGSRH